MDNAVIVGSGKHPAHWNRWIRIWLSTGIVMLMIQVLLGGVTRLTGSGLSITEWKPLLGAIPPMDKASWQVSFGNYQQIAQFKKLNPHFTLVDYQAIFFWGMAAPGMGTADGPGFRPSPSQLSVQKEDHRRNGHTHAHSLYIGRSSGRRRLDHGSKQLE